VWAIVMITMRAHGVARQRDSAREQVDWKRAFRWRAAHPPRSSDHCAVDDPVPRAPANERCRFQNHAARPAAGSASPSQQRAAIGHRAGRCSANPAHDAALCRGLVISSGCARIAQLVAVLRDQRMQFSESLEFHLMRDDLDWVRLPRPGLAIG